MMKRYNAHLLDKLLHSIRIRTRMILYFLVLMFLPSLFVSHLFNRHIADIEQEELNRLLTQTQSASSILSHEMNTCRTLLHSVLESRECTQILTQGLSPQNGEALLRVCELLSLHGIADNAPRFQFTLFYDGADAVDSALHPLSAHPLHRRISSLNSGQQLITDDFCIQDGERVKGISIYGVRHEGGHTLAAQLFVQAGSLITMLEPLRPTALSEFYLLSGDGEILLSTGNSITGFKMHGFSSFNQERSFYFAGEYESNPVNYSVVYEDELYLVLLTPHVELDASWRNLQMYLIYLLLILLVGGAAAFCRIYDDVMTPVRQLRLSMDDVSQGKLESVVIYDRRDEFSELMISYGRMLEKIRHIIDEMLRLEKVKRHTQNLARESEIKALQAQINPHMLYNTLDSINWLALKYGARDISRLIRNLADFFRYSLNKGNDHITFAQELKQMDSYLSIQKIRFGDRLAYEIDFPDDLLACYTLKLIMQPFIENCVVHAFSRTGVKGLIRISGRLQAGDILLTIDDNGVGADVERMQEILADDSRQAKHYGMRNVAQRLRLCFGERYRVRFSLNEYHGLRVSILLPVIRNLEEIHD